MRFAALCVLFSVTYAARPSEACSPPPPGFWAWRPMESGQTLPRNGVVFAQGFEIGEPQAVVLDFDFFVPVTVEEHLGMLKASVQPEEFEILGPSQMLLSSSDDFIEPINIDYTISEQRDDEPPSSIEVQQIEFEYISDADPGLCQIDGFRVQVQIEQGTDNDQIAAYALFETTRNDRLVFRASRLSAPTSKGVSLWTHERPDQAGVHCYAVMAIDHAGNESRLLRDGTCVDLQIPGNTDAGVVDTGLLDAGDTDAGRSDAGRLDAGVADTGGSQADTGGLVFEESGCGCSSQGRQSGPQGLLWIGLFSLLVGASRNARL